MDDMAVIVQLPVKEKRQCILYYLFAFNWNQFCLLVCLFVCFFVCLFVCLFVFSCLFFCYYIYPKRQD